MPGTPQPFCRLTINVDDDMGVQQIMDAITAGVANGIIDRKFYWSAEGVQPFEMREKEEDNG